MARGMAPHPAQQASLAGWDHHCYRLEAPPEGSALITFAPNQSPGLGLLKGGTSCVSGWVHKHLAASPGEQHPAGSTWHHPPVEAPQGEKAQTFHLLGPHHPSSVPFPLELAASPAQESPSSSRPAANLTFFTHSLQRAWRKPKGAAQSKHPPECSSERELRLARSQPAVETLPGTSSCPSHQMGAEGQAS